MPGLYQIILSLTSLADALIKRGRATGELTPAQNAAIDSLASDVFGRYENAPPPPPPSEVKP